VSRDSRWGEDLDWGSGKERSSLRFAIHSDAPWPVVLVGEGLTEGSRWLANGSARYTG
jgi:hypothetical protein